MQFPLLLFCQILDGIDRQRNRENQADRGDSRYAAWRFRPDVRQAQDTGTNEHNAGKQCSHNILDRITAFIDQLLIHSEPYLGKMLKESTPQHNFISVSFHETVCSLVKTRV